MLLRTGARFLRRIVITIVGVAILAVGGVMLVAPGPGFLVIALGLFTLGFEYEWARRRLDYVRQKVADLAELAVARPWSTVGSVLGALGLIVGGVVVGAGLVDDLPASSWWTGGSLIAGGVLALGTIVVSLYQARAARRTAVPMPRETSDPSDDPTDADAARTRYRDPTAGAGGADRSTSRCSTR